MSSAVDLFDKLLDIYKATRMKKDLQGWIDLESGEVELNLSADFLFSAASFYKASIFLSCAETPPSNT